MARSPRTNQPKILSHYRLLQELGRGAMGVVYEGVDRRDGSRVAVKTLHQHLTHDRSFRERFEREAHIGVLLRSPYTVQLLDYGVQAGHYFIVMEFVEGGALTALASDGPLPSDRAVRIGTQVARALQEAEARGVVHRDIKPDNILVGDDDSVKVTDFGIARQMAGGTLTTTGAFIGTLSYAAPEQFEGAADHRSDIWSLGATLYFLLTGRAPFSGSLQQIALAIRERPVDDVPLAHVPADLAKTILRCLEKDPAARYQSAVDLAADLERADLTPLDSSKASTVALASRPSSPPPAPPTETAVAHPDDRGPVPLPDIGAATAGRRRRALVYATAAGAVVIASIIAVGGFLLMDGSDTMDPGEGLGVGVVVPTGSPTPGVVPTGSPTPVAAEGSEAIVGAGCPVAWATNTDGILKASVGNVPLLDSDLPIVAAINCGNAASIVAGVQKSKDPLTGAFTDDFIGSLNCPPPYSDLESAILKSPPKWLSDHSVEIETTEVWDHQSLEEVYQITDATGRWLISSNNQSNGETNWPCR